MATPTPAREPHALALKVLRTARPSLVPSSTPFYEDGLLGSDALKTLELNGVGEGRDHGLSGALQLPNSFGTIYLGETFSAILSLSNDSPSSPNPSTIALAPQLKVEMHTSGPPNAPAGTGGLKHLLEIISAPSDQLAPGQSVEGLVSHEIKELGMHSLVCTVTYAVSTLTEGGPRTVSRSFRKVYKFAVSNPLSVRTKAHSPNSLVASSSLSSIEKRKVFLEVQVQNNAEQAMWFERMRFEPVVGWGLEDVNEGLFADTEALLHPGGVRQFLFVLLASPRVPYVEPGGSQGLGRLDIVWRTPHGERGSLQTSMLGQRVPIPPAPLHLPATAPLPADKPLPPPTRGASPSPGASSATNSPIKTPAPYRPAHQQALVAPSSTQLGPPPAVPNPPVAPEVGGLTFELLVESIKPEQILREVPFEIRFALKVRDLAPSNGRARRVRLAAQHVQWVTAGGMGSPAPVVAGLSDSGPPSLVVPPSSAPPLDLTTALPPTAASTVLPPPFPLLSAASPPTPGPKPSREILRLGNAVVHLDELFLNAPPLPEAASLAGDAAAPPPPPNRRESATAEFKMRFLPTEVGLMRVGGLRILLLENEEVGAVAVKPAEGGRQTSARVVSEHEVIAEVWVSSGRGPGA